MLMSKLELLVLLDASMLLCEFGPVSLIVALTSLPPPPLQDPRLAAEELLLTDTVASVLLSFEAFPLIALPALVLLLTLALPVSARCVFEFRRFKRLLLVKRKSCELRTWTRLFEFGPVVSIEPV
jgi:hypothetical protein